jgi:hypothetical protein
VPPNSVCVTRPSRFGNYVSLPKEQTAEEHSRAVEEYRQWLYAPVPAATAPRPEGEDEFVWEDDTRAVGAQAEGDEGSR